jgi:nicotinic acid mononucleotide adenylyltransferase
MRSGEFDDGELTRLRGFHRVLSIVRERRRPSARLVAAPETTPRSVAIVSGAFDPPTRAHEALARAALRQGAEAALFALGTVTLDKRETGLALEDRVALVGELAARDPRLGVVVHNSGLYADQAAAIRAAVPSAVELSFVIGLDKLPQILDPRYYDDLERGLERLFSRARLLVAPRGGDDRRVFERLRSSATAERWRDRILYRQLGPRWREVSATTARAALAEGRDPGALLPAGWAARLISLGAYEPGRRSRYRERVRRIRRTPANARRAGFA